MKRYKPFFIEDAKEIAIQIEHLQAKIQMLRDKESKVGLSVDDKQKYLNQINQIQNQITKLKDKKGNK